MDAIKSNINQLADVIEFNAILYFECNDKSNRIDTFSYQNHRNSFQI